MREKQLTNLLIPYTESKIWSRPKVGQGISVLTLNWPDCKKFLFYRANSLKPMDIHAIITFDLNDLDRIRRDDRYFVSRGTRVTFQLRYSSQNLSWIERRLDIFPTPQQRRCWCSSCNLWWQCKLQTRSWHHSAAPQDDKKRASWRIDARQVLRNRQSNCGYWLL